MTMSSENNPFKELPGFKETIARLAHVPPQDAPEQPEDGFIHCVIDETNGITYKIISPRPLTAADVRRSIVRAFSRTDAWPDESGEVEIRL